MRRWWAVCRFAIDLARKNRSSDRRRTALVPFSLLRSRLQLLQVPGKIPLPIISCSLSLGFQADDQLGGLVHSQQVLLALTQKGASREDAYKMVQRNAMQIWADGGSYLDKLKILQKFKDYSSVYFLQKKKKEVEN